MCRVYAALEALRRSAQPRFGSPRERLVVARMYHSDSCTELASCKDTSKQPRDLARPALQRYSPATSHDSPTASTCAGDSALQISSRRIAPRGSTRARESLGAARPTRRDETPRAEGAPPDARRSARRQRARAATHRERHQ
jgi:hypothetical protein